MADAVVDSFLDDYLAEQASGAANVVRKYEEEQRHRHDVTDHVIGVEDQEVEEEEEEEEDAWIRIKVSNHKGETLKFRMHKVGGDVKASFYLAYFILVHAHRHPRSMNSPKPTVHDANWKRKPWQPPSNSLLTAIVLLGRRHLRRRAWRMAIRLMQGGR